MLQCTSEAFNCQPGLALPDTHQGIPFHSAFTLHVAFHRGTPLLASYVQRTWGVVSGSDTLLGVNHIKRFLWVAEWLPYAIGLYRVAHHEKRITEVTSLEESLTHLLGVIRRGHELREGSLEFLQDKNWREMP